MKVYLIIFDAGGNGLGCHGAYTTREARDKAWRALKLNEDREDADGVEYDRDTVDLQDYVQD